MEKYYKFVKEASSLDNLEIDDDSLIINLIMNNSIALLESFDELLNLTYPSVVIATLRQVYEYNLLLIGLINGYISYENFMNDIKDKGYNSLKHQCLGRLLDDQRKKQDDKTFLKIKESFNQVYSRLSQYTHVNIDKLLYFVTEMLGTNDAEYKILLKKDLRVLFIQIELQFFLTALNYFNWKEDYPILDQKYIKEVVIERQQYHERQEPIVKRINDIKTLHNRLKDINEKALKGIDEEVEK